MLRLLNAAIIYLAIGLASGVFYREFTKHADGFAPGGYTQLSVVHTHVLLLGFFMFLLVLVLEKVFGISASPKLFSWFFWLYNLGLVVSSIMMVIHGIMQIGGGESTGMTAGIAGLGHMLMTAGLIVFVIALRRAVKASAVTS